MGATSVGVEVDVADGLRDPEASDVDGLAVGVDHVDEVGVALVQTDGGVVAFKKRPRWVKTWKFKISIKNGSGFEYRDNLEREWPVKN